MRISEPLPGARAAPTSRFMALANSWQANQAEAVDSNNRQVHPEVMRSLQASGFYVAATMADRASQDTTPGSRFYQALQEAFGKVDGADLLVRVSAEQDEVSLQDIPLQSAACLTCPTYTPLFWLNGAVVGTMCTLLARTYGGMTLPLRERHDHAAPSRDFCIFGPDYWEMITTPDGENHPNRPETSVQFSQSQEVAARRAGAAPRADEKA